MKKVIILTTTILFSMYGLFAQNNMEITWQQCYGGSNNDSDPNILKTDFGYFQLSETQSDDGNITNFWGEGDIWLTAIDSVGIFLWGRCYGGTSVDIPKNIISDENGYYYFGGWTASNDGDVQSGNHGEFDRWIVKIDAMGEIIWKKCYGGSGSDYGQRLKMSSNGNIIAFSATTSSNGDVPVNYGYLDAWITIIDPENGEILKNKVFGNIGQNNIFDIVETLDEGFFFTSKAQEVEGMVQGNFHGVSDVWAVKTDSNLNIEWQTLYGGSSRDYQGWGLLELVNGYIFLANTISNDGDVSGFHGIVGDEETYDIWVVRIDTIGNIIWEKCLGGSNYDYGRKLIQSDDGGFVVFAQTDSDDGDVWDLHTDYNNQNSDIWMVKLSANGDIEWSRCYGGIGEEKVSFDAVIKKTEDDYVISGITYYYLNPSGDVGCNPIGMRDLWLFEIKDCENYMPATPQTPNGPDTLCITTDSIAIYNTMPAPGAWSYEWQIVPGEAGNITGDSTTATLHWASGWEGMAEISVRSWNDCGQSAWSEVKTSWAYSCLGIPGNILENYFQLFPNPATTQISLTLRDMENDPQYSIIIYNMLGIEMDKIPFHSKQQFLNIDISRYPTGMYVAMLKRGSEELTRRTFVKK